MPGCGTKGSTRQQGVHSGVPQGSPHNWDHYFLLHIVTYNIVNKIFPIYTSKNNKKKCRDMEHNLHKDPFVDEIA